MHALPLTSPHIVDQSGVTSVVYLYFSVTVIRSVPETDTRCGEGLTARVEMNCYLEKLVFTRWRTRPYWIIQASHS